MLADYLLPVAGGFLRFCSVPEAALTPVAGGYHCASCRRLVHDFRQASSAEVARVRAAAPDGRFNIAPPAASGGFSRRLRCFVVALVLIVGRGLTAQEALAQVRQPQLETAIDLDLSELKLPSTERPPFVPPPTTVCHIQSGPEYLDGGEAGMRRFIQQHVRWPANGGSICAEGRVWIMFDVGTDGKVYDARVAKSLHPLLDAEALKGVRALGLFKPAVAGDKPITISVTVPVKFLIE